MAKIPSESIFLLEFLVDGLNLNKCALATAPPGEKCVCFQFLDNKPIEVCEEDFTIVRKYGRDNESIKNGKSCLFSLTPEMAETLSDEFNIAVSVFGKVEEGEDNKVELGTTTIPMSGLFNELIECAVEDSGACPVAKTLKEEYNLINTYGRAAGTIAVYIRLSCFGKIIVTQFQMNLDDKSVLFKDRYGKSLYRYKKSESNKSNVTGAQCTPRNGFAYNQGASPYGVMPNANAYGVIPTMNNMTYAGMGYGAPNQTGHNSINRDVARNQKIRRQNYGRQCNNCGN